MLKVVVRVDPEDLEVEFEVGGLAETGSQRSVILVEMERYVAKNFRNGSIIISDHG